MSKALNILLVEDDPDDIELMEDALKGSEVIYKLETVKQGDQVLPHLEQTQYKPDVIVLDLNLPRIHGREVLKSLKDSLRLKNIPVVILTTSSAKKEMEYCMTNGADEYLIKPVTMEGFSKIINSIIYIAKRP
jgi:CheY-like chemotaxis protein